MDILLPDGSGVELCKQIRAKSNVSILFLTSLGDRQQIVQGLKADGDDFITKLYRIEELIARIEAKLRRLEMLNCIELESGENHLLLDPKAKNAFYNGMNIGLKPKEYQILAVSLKIWTDI